MSWFSILPAHLTVIETWVIRFFLLLGILTIGPWALFIVYDVILYIVRSIAYEIPYIGGRARGRQRPRAPSLAERPNGRARTFSIGGPIASGSDTDDFQVVRMRSRNTFPSDDSNAITEEE